MFCYNDHFSPAAMLEPVVAVAVCNSAYNKALADVGDALAELGSTCHMKH
jgi:hypothetical protein